MTEPEQQEPNEEQIEDLDVPEEDAEEIAGGRNPGPAPVPIPYPN
jgi:hypothetical protein